jgi:hypothetical protein
VFLGGWAATLLVVDLAGFQVNPPRNNTSVAFLGAALGQFLWLATSGRSAGLRGAGYAFAGFGLGMAGGRVLANAAMHLEAWGYTINHWNVMEIACGFVGGGVFAFGMLGLGRVEPAGEAGEFRGPAVLGALFVLGVIPTWHRLARVPEQLPAWPAALRDLGCPDSDRLAGTLLFAVNVVCAAGWLGAVLWAAALARGWAWPGWLPAVWLSAVMLAFQNLTSFYFWRPSRPGYLDTRTAFWGLFLLMLACLAITRPRPATGAARPTRWGRLAVGTAAALGLAVALASVTNGERTMRSANTRWPVWAWTEGPFPGQGKPR